jgi:hypothetical protein
MLLPMLPDILQVSQSTICYLSPKLEGRINPQNNHRGVFVCQPVQAGEIMVVWGGQILTVEQLNRLHPKDRHFVIQIAENLYQFTPGDDPAAWVNHSCNPNAGIIGQIFLVAIHDISSGVELCYDYAMTDGNSQGFTSFKCNCGAINCRRWITGNDWKNPDLWERYSGYFSTYLQEKIEQTKSTYLQNNSYLIVTGIFTILVGKIPEQIVAKSKLMTLGYALNTLCTFAYLLVSSQRSLLLVQIGLGIASALSTPTWNALYAKYERQGNQKQIGYVWALADGQTEIVTGIGVLLGGLIVNSFSFQLLFVVMGIIQFIATLYVAKIFKYQSEAVS